MAELGRHFLLTLFTEYYQELAEARWAITRGRLTEYLELPPAQDLPANELVVSLLFKKLRSALTAQQRRVRSQATLYEQKDYLRALYVMTALTDEQLLLDTDWDLSSLWQEQLMESSFFRTAQAGTRFYDYLQEAISDRTRASSRADLASVFLLALFLGFKGRYRSSKGEREIRRLCVDLHRRLDSKLQGEYLFAQAYQHGLREVEDPKRHRVSSLDRWYKLGGVAFVLYLLVSSAIWLSANQTLSETLSKLRCGVDCAVSVENAFSNSDPPSRRGAGP